MSETNSLARLALVRASKVLAIVLLLLVPFYVQAYWLQVGLFAMSAVIGAIGLNLLLGTAGQLSLGHAFFVAVGAYGYVWAGSDSVEGGSQELSGLNLPPLLALVVAVLLSGIAGALFSPIAGRVRGLYLAVATLALVFIGLHVMNNAQSITGGTTGRSVPEMEILGFTFGDDAPTGLVVLGVPFERLERLWYLGLVLVILAWFLARNLLDGRQGHALSALRDSELAASVMGTPVSRYRAAVFTISSMYAGCAGALLGMVYERIVADSFGLLLSINFVAMIVIGGLGSVGGAVAGAVFVSSLPLVVAYYADRLPLVAATGSGEAGLTPIEASHFVYGAAIIAVLALAPGGLAGITRHGLATLRRRKQGSIPSTNTTSPTQQKEESQWKST